MELMYQLRLMYRCVMAILSQLTTPPDFVRLAANPLRWRLMSELANSDYRVRELASRVEEPQNLVSYHLRLLRDGGLVTSTRSTFDGRDSYYHLDLDRCASTLAGSGAALHPALHMEASPPIPPAAANGRRPGRVAVLFVCSGNSARSPIAEALLRHHTDGGVSVTCAGTVPRTALHPNTLRVLREEYDIDISGQLPRHLHALTGRRFDYVITLCDKAREVCPDFDDHPRWVHWSIPDPTTAADTDQDTYPAFQRTAAEIDTRVRHLLPVLEATDRQEVQS